MQLVDFLERLLDLRQVLAPRAAGAADAQRGMGHDGLQLIIVFDQKSISCGMREQCQFYVLRRAHQSRFLCGTRRCVRIWNDHQLPRQHHDIANVLVEDVELGLNMRIERKAKFEQRIRLRSLVDKCIGSLHRVHLQDCGARLYEGATGGVRSCQGCLECFGNGLRESRPILTLATARAALIYYCGAESRR